MKYKVVMHYSGGVDEELEEVYDTEKEASDVRACEEDQE